MAFDRLDTNTIVTLHSSGGRRSLGHGRSAIVTWQTSVRELQRPAEHEDHGYADLYPVHQEPRQGGILMLEFIFILHILVFTSISDLWIFSYVSPPHLSTAGKQRRERGAQEEGRRIETRAWVKSSSLCILLHHVSTFLSVYKD